MPRETSTGRPDNLPLIPLKDRQADIQRKLDILRLLGKGNSLRDEEIPQEFQGDANKELRGIYRAFGVSGGTAAVVHALNIGLLKTEELVVKDFDWSLFNVLRSNELAILDAFTHARGQSLTEEEFNALGIETAQDPKSFVNNSMQRAYEDLGLRNKTQAVVHYYAFREKQQEKGKAIVPVAMGILTDKEVQILGLFAKGLKQSIIAKRSSTSGSSGTVTNHKNSILKKLGVAGMTEAIAKAREMGILKS